MKGSKKENGIEDVSVWYDHFNGLLNNLINVSDKSFDDDSSVEPTLYY
jgi:hypothetical protein